MPSPIIELMEQRLSGGDIEVPMLPEVANKVIQLTQDADSDAEDLARLIQSDQPLAAHVMRIANSALYSPNTTLVSLQQAIARLGMRIISDIALAASVNSKMFDAPGYNHLIEIQIKFSLHSGIWAKEVARTCRRNVEAAFLAGLLHDIGRPVAIQATLESAKSLGKKLEPVEVLKTANHFERQLSNNVVRTWEMPSMVCEVVDNFHDYSQAGKSKEQTMIVVAGTKFAARFTDVKGKPKLSEEQLMAQDVFADLNLYPEDLENLKEKAEDVKSALEAIAT